MNRVNNAMTEKQAIEFLDEFTKIWAETIKTPGKRLRETTPVESMGFQEDRGDNRERPRFICLYKEESKVSDGPRYVWEPRMSSPMWLMVQATPRLKALVGKSVFK